MEVARVVQRIGDDAVLDALSDPEPRVRVAAMRAVPWMGAPERALGRLSELATGDDPFLAPPAALAVWRVARRLELPALLSREAELAPLDEVASVLRRGAGESSVRADLRQLLGAAADSIAHLRSDE